MSDTNYKCLDRKEFLKRTASGLAAFGAAGLTVPSFLQPVSAAVNLKYRELGKTGIKVTEVGAGGSRTNEPSVIKRALDLGVNFIDTGRMYAGGRNEEMIGKVIKPVRKNIVIQSKIDQKIQRDAKAMEKSIDDSLRALQSDYVDIMIIRGATKLDMVHNPVVHETFEKAKKAGKIRACGFSCHSSNAHEMVLEGIKTGVYDVIMVPYNHAGNFRHTIYGIYSEWDQDALENSFEKAVANGIGIVCMKTCSGGPMKTGDHPRGTYRAGLKWILRNKNVSTLAAGMASFREVDEDVGAMG
ncbi:aldo/keto reductase [Candidatus Latescibacterota bacterium]